VLEVVILSRDGFSGLAGWAVAGDHEERIRVGASALVGVVNFGSVSGTTNVQGGDTSVVLSLGNVQVNHGGGGVARLSTLNGSNHGGLTLPGSTGKSGVRARTLRDRSSGTFACSRHQRVRHIGVGLSIVESKRSRFGLNGSLEASVGVQSVSSRSIVHGNEQGKGRGGSRSCF